MEILYKSTRGTGECVKASEAIFKGRRTVRTHKYSQAGYSHGKIGGDDLSGDCL